jgi:hypothetical protein
LVMSSVDMLRALWTVIYVNLCGSLPMGQHASTSC